MSHLHIPDGLLPVWLWVGGLLVAGLLLVRASRRARGQSPQKIAYQGALGGLMLAAMAIPLGPLEYHLTLAGPMGILLGGGGAFQVAFVVSAILALMGHGGLTVVGLNALVLGAGAGVAHRAYRPLARRMKPAAALAAGTALGQAVAGALWVAVMWLATRGWGPGTPPVDQAALDHRLGVLSIVVLPLWLLGIAVESLVAFGLGRFLARVQPGLLPQGGGTVARDAARPAPESA
jgi:cobalt/nickel transport system permease protein